MIDSSRPTELTTGAAAAAATTTSQVFAQAPQAGGRERRELHARISSSSIVGRRPEQQLWAKF
jgi:hypothetical protein